MRILITGGAGFIGSHLAAKLHGDGHYVEIVDDLSTGTLHNLPGQLRGEPGFKQADVRTLSPWIGPAPFDRIYHLAAPASPVQYQANPLKTATTCAEGTRRLLDLAAAHRARFLLASTSEVYGDPLEHPQHENYFGNVNPIGLRACYDEGKRYAETLTAIYTREYGVETRIARIFNTYGPHMRIDDGRVVSNFIVNALRSEPVVIYGDGLQTRSLCYVTDMVEALVQLMESQVESGLPVNLGNDEEITIGSLAASIMGLAGIPGRVIHAPLPADDPIRRRPDVARARSLLNWRPKVSLMLGLTDTIAAVRDELRLME